MIEEIDEKTRKKWNIILAVALLKDIFKRGDIKESTFHAIEKDAEQMIETLSDT